MKDVISLIKNTSFFFVIGRPRSGTTLIQSILDAHPNVNIPSECELIRFFSMRYAHVKELTDDVIEHLMRDLKLQDKIDTWTIDFLKVKQNLILLKGKFDIQTIVKAIYIELEPLWCFTRR